MLCLVARYGGKVVKYPVLEGERTIGSSRELEIVLPFPGISRRHASLARRDGTVSLTDLGSKNGLWAGNERVGHCLIRPGESVRIGRAQVSLEEGSTSDFDMEIPLSPRGDHDPGDETASEKDGGGSPSAAMALRFVRDAESVGGPQGAEGRREFLEEAASLLGAVSIAVLEGSDPSDVTVQAVGGSLPDQALIEEMLGPSDTAKTVRALRHRHRGRAVVAVFSRLAPPIQPWQKDLFEYVADRVLAEKLEAGKRERRALPRARVRRPGEPLVFPAAMVVGASTSIHDLLDQIRATVRSRLDVLLLGETGTGKELFALMLHASGPMAEGPFLAINCAAIPNELLEAELFGVQARVATGVDARVGLFQRANGGTVFLDEIGELAPALQAKLLRVLQEREVFPLGASQPRKVDVHVISASNRNLHEAVKGGTFRADLYYRLRGLQFHIPPLRERLEDLPVLVLAFAERAAAKHEKRIRGISRKALDVLRKHDWPGNVRELQNEIERAILVAPDDGVLHAEHFRPIVWLVEQKAKEKGQREGNPDSRLTDTAVEATPDTPGAGSAAPAGPPRAKGSETLNLQDRVDALERTTIEEALREARGNKSLAARMLGITRNGLAMKITRLLRG